MNVFNNFYYYSTDFSAIYKHTDILCVSVFIKNRAISAIFIMNDLKFSRHVGVNQGQVPTFMSYLKKKKKSGSTVRVEYITIFGADSEVFFILTSGYIVSLSSLNIILIVLQPFLYGCQTMEIA